MFMISHIVVVISNEASYSLVLKNQVGKVYMQSMHTSNVSFQSIRAIHFFYFSPLKKLAPCMYYV
jgi:hypothetical protein